MRFNSYPAAMQPKRPRAAKKVPRHPRHCPSMGAGGATPGCKSFHGHLTVRSRQAIDPAFDVEDRVYSGDGLQRDGGDVMSRLALPGTPTRTPR